MIGFAVRWSCFMVRSAPFSFPTFSNASIYRTANYNNNLCMFCRDVHTYLHKWHMKHLLVIRANIRLRCTVLTVWLYIRSSLRVFYCMHATKPAHCRLYCELAVHFQLLAASVVQWFRLLVRSTCLSDSTCFYGGIPRLRALTNKSYTFRRSYYIQSLSLFFLSHNTNGANYFIVSRHGSGILASLTRLRHSSPTFNLFRRTISIDLIWLAFLFRGTAHAHDSWEILTRWSSLFLWYVVVSDARGLLFDILCKVFPKLLH